MSSDFTSSAWHTPLALEELHGNWVSTRGEYTYPLVINGKNYLRFALTPTNDTDLWKNFANSRNMDLSEIWTKRFPLSQAIYSSPEKIDILPEVDENGIQKGRKFFIEDEKIFSRLEILIPERILAVNLNYFLVRRDGMSLREQGTFHLLSKKFQNRKSTEILFYKMGANQW